MKKILLLNFAFLIFNSTLFSQSPNWQWAKGIGGTGDDRANTITTDASGNVYTIGGFQGTVDFDPGVGVFNLISAGGSYDIFISKLDDSGNFIWAKAMGRTGNDRGYAISIDPSGSGDVYTTGFFEDTVDFDPGTGTFNLSAAGSIDIFITKLDSSGNFVWAKAMGGTNSEWGYSIALDSSGNVYTTGQFHGTADFDPDSLAVFNLTSAGSSDIFISKLDNSGNFLWAKAMNGTQQDESFSIAVDDSGNVYTTGYFTDAVDFDPGAGIFNLISSFGSWDIFISKLDSSGNFIWAKRIGGGSSDYAFSIALDASSNIYTTGFFGGTVDFNPGVGTFLLNSAGYYDTFISKLDNSGNFVWAKAMGGTATSGVGGYSIALDNSGNVYTTGIFLATVDFDPGAGVSNLTSAGGLDIFISKLDNSGNFLWAKAMGGINTERGEFISLDASGNVYVTGDFSSPYITFGSTTLINNSAGTSDIFIAKLDTSTITGLESVKNNNGISVYPNPTTNQFTILLANSNKKVEITITDITGKIIYSTTATKTQKIEVNTKDFAGGIYLAQIQSDEFLKTEKLIITKQ